jgi:stage III sporulation protein AD
MDITRIIGLALVTAIFLVLLRRDKPVFALLLSMAFSAVIFYLMMSQLSVVVDVFSQIGSRADVNYFFLGTVLRVSGIAYLAEFAASLCADAGEQAVAKRIEFAAKIIIAVLSLPLVTAIIESVLDLLP